MDYTSIDDVFHKQHRINSEKNRRSKLVMRISGQCESER